MCEVCGATIGHKQGCPEADYDSGEKIGTCEICGKSIYDGDDYFNIDGEKSHYECFCDEYRAQKREVYNMEKLHHMDCECGVAADKAEQYREFMFNPDNIHNCSECPERGNNCGNGLPCGQQNCWVSVHCG